MKPLSLTLLFGLLSVPWSTFAQDATTGTVRGQVEDTSTLQKPIEGVRVVAVDLAGMEYEALTDIVGEYAITGLPAGRYLMSFHKDGYEEREGKRLEIIAGRDHYMPVKMIKSRPPWLLIIGLGIVAIVIIGLVVAASSRDDSPQDS